MSAQRLFRNPKAVSRALAGEEGAVVLNIETTAYFRLNPIGLLIWERLEEPASIEELVEHVRDNVEDAPRNLRKDVEGFVTEMRAKNLLGVAWE